MDNSPTKNTHQNEQSFAAFTQERPSESMAIDIPDIALPKGGGALKAIDERFEVNAANGTADLSFPLPISEGRGGFSPNLALAYNSGGGNGPFGLGWSLGQAHIQRRTDRGLPRYRSGGEEDTFTFAGGEDLVPYLDEAGGWQVRETTVLDLTVKRYRPRVESGFARIERITDATGQTWWKVTSRENVVTLFGFSEAARLADPRDPLRVFQWLPEFRYDDKGNWLRFDYKPEDLENVPAEVHERNRFNGNAPFANRYLKRVTYGNHRPWFADDPYRPSLPDELVASFFELVFDYGDHDTERPTPTPDRSWPAREDAFSSYRAGFEIRTWRLCQRVLMFHRFEELGDAPCLIRSLDIAYEPSSINASGRAEVTYLSSLTQRGYIRLEDGTYSAKAMPPMTFEYQHLTWNSDIQTVAEDAIANAPTGLSAGYRWVDLHGEGLPGILTEQADGWYYKSNLGDVEGTQSAHFSAARAITDKPSFSGLGTGVLAIQDLEANGRKQVVVNQEGVRGFFEISDGAQPFQAFETMPRVAVEDRNTRQIDLTGDGKPDLVITEEHAFLWHPSEGKKGYGPAEQTLKAFDEERGPTVVFADRQQRIFLADMSGDGLTDIVRIRNGEVCYWANMGYGQFSAKVTMSGAPLFAPPDQFDPRLIQLADISGTGATDLVYLGQNLFRAYINLGGNAWSDPHDIAPFLPINARTQVAVIDLLGTGTSGIVWSSPLPADSRMPMRFIDLMDSKKPHLLTSYANNLGKVVRFEYRSSTLDYLRDKRAGQPWATKLPFPVQVLSRIATEDRIAQTRFAAEYRYHHGYYDYAEREFRGFGMVEQQDSEHYTAWKANQAGTHLDTSQNLYQAPMLTKTWFHTGAFRDREHILDQFRKDYWPETYRRTFPDDPLPVSEPELEDAIPVAAPSIADPNIAANLSTHEWREALRACKGMMLRQETFALDGEDAAPTSKAYKTQFKPYSVATHNCRIQLLQPAAHLAHAVFLVTESEAITIQYERDETDPRISHTLNTRLDELGQVLESASVVYPRAQVDPALPADIRDQQATTRITYGQMAYSNDCSGPDAYRLRAPVETKSFEITGLSPSGPLYRLVDFEQILTSGSDLIAYEQAPTPGLVQRRPIEHSRTLYLADDLTGPLPLGQLEPKGIPHESYQLAYTPALLAELYQPGQLPADPTELEDLLGDNDADGTSSQAKLVHRGDANWWVPSGTTQLIDEDAGESAIDAQARFYAPLSFTDPFGSVTRVRHYRDYFLFIDEIVDAIGNRLTVETFNFRILAPSRMRDLNDNLSEVLVDELGLVKATAVMGKGGEADDLDGLTEVTTQAERDQIRDYFTLSDTQSLRAAARALLGHATTRFVYDYDRFRDTQAALEQQLEAAPGTDPCAMVKLAPVVAGIIGRERHHADDPNSPLQLSFEYADGGGNIAMTKSQSHPGEAYRLEYLPDCSYTVELVDTSLDDQLRWIGDGRTVLNNKGNPVKQYEPYFSVTPFYEDARELVETGVTPVIFYDAPGRVIKTEYPDGTVSRAEFTAWRQATFDANDTVLESRWYADRNSPDPGQAAPADSEELAAWKAAGHAGTPSIRHMDNLGRVVYILDHNRAGGADTFHETTIHLDIEGNALRVVDARGNTVATWAYNLLGQRVLERTMDKGARWSLNNVAGNPVRLWDERGHTFTTSYDALQRPLTMHVAGGDGDVPLDAVFQMMVYGEGQPGDTANNLRGQVFHHYDPSGKATSVRHDFKGNLLEGQRQFTADYKTTPDWRAADPDSLLEAETFTTVLAYDALSRITATTHPDGSLVTPGYNASSLLDSLVANMAAPGGGPREDITFVQNIRYNQKGLRANILYGNGVRTTYRYDPLTFRLIHLQSRRQDNTVLQDLRYTFDAVGNITQVGDDAKPTVFFDNHMVTPKADYTYDALYRLVEASGREHIAQVDFGGEDQWQDLAFLNRHSPGDPMAWRTYTQHYRYDNVGNLSEMNHAAVNGNWTRSYTYEADTNRLVRTTVGAQTYNYAHHPNHGFMTGMPHLQVLAWDFRDRLQAVSRQAVAAGTPEMTYYVYDAKGQRVRKVTENQAAEGVAPTRKDERLYLGGVEIYRKHSGADSGLERTTLHLLDDSRRIAMVDSRNDVADGTDPRTIRYQFDNHLGSVALETDQAAEVISYEEYHPYGTSAYRAVNADIGAAAKRYRYTGMERDEESGFAYHGARYYLPWLGRWLSADPIGIKDGLNLYAYARGNPIVFNDPGGTEARISVDQTNRTITYSTTVHVFATAAEIAVLEPYARQAEAFYQNPTIETQEATEQRLAGAQLLAPGTNQYTDDQGRTWTVNFDVTYQFHDTAVVQPPFDYDAIVADAGGYVANLAAGEAQLANDVGFQPGDNIMTPGAGGSTGGVVGLVSDAGNAAFPTFGEPISRMVGEIATGPAYILESLIHETGHFLGWDHRYGDVQIIQNDPNEGFEFDMMAGGVGAGRRALTMHPDHIRTSAEFGIAVADGRNLIDQPLRGIQVDDVEGGDIEQFADSSHNAATTPEYTARQQLLATELIPHFRDSVVGIPPIPMIDFSDIVGPPAGSLEDMLQNPNTPLQPNPGWIPTPWIIRF